MGQKDTADQKPDEKAQKVAQHAQRQGRSGKQKERYSDVTGCGINIAATEHRNDVAKK